jgi:uncharacterized protein YhbP (UPF0306 family)
MEASKLIEKARYILRNNRYMTLATYSMGVLPWASPVAYALDSSWTFYWYSAQNATHSKNISQNRNVTAAIFNSAATFEEVDGIQLAGLADMVSVSELQLVHKLYWEHCFPDPKLRKRYERPMGDFQGGSILRFYHLMPMEMWKYDTETTDIDQRTQINLRAL